MRYVVIGAGAVGGTIGARLHQAGHEVVLVARGAHYEAMRRNGLRLITPNSDEVLDVQVADGPVDADALIIATKSQDTIAALDPWPRDLPVVCAQNGVDNERTALRRFERVYGMCVWLPATHLEPGVVVAHGVPKSGMLHVGRYPQGVDEFSAQLTGDLLKSGFVAENTGDVMRWKYGKLLNNLPNAVQALTGSAPELARRAQEEGMAVLEEAGLPYSTSADEAEKRGKQVEIGEIDGVARSGGSSWQSLARASGSIEADYLNGEIVLIARELGRYAPVNEVLQREANRAAREKLPPGSMPAERLAALIDERYAAVSR
ncbi:ketopantoate reductase family protein [Nonomuraea sp. NPDC050556]|uniref:ketopantoate reductase family protein n=1 Tax=Nonomuraea sp. NPDC050556 TaxID=3364369 RepID=UPI00379AE0C6